MKLSYLLHFIEVPHLSIVQELHYLCTEAVRRYSLADVSITYDNQCPTTLALEIAPLNGLTYRQLEELQHQLRETFINVRASYMGGLRKH